MSRHFADENLIPTTQQDPPPFSDPEYLPEASADAVLSAQLEILIVSGRIVTALQHLPAESGPMELARWNCGLTRELVSYQVLYLNVYSLKGHESGMESTLWALHLLPVSPGLPEEIPLPTLFR